MTSFGPLSSAPLSGQNEQGPLSYTLTAALGTFTETGIANSLIYKRIMAAGLGTYSLTGTPVTLAHDHDLHPDVGAYFLTGTDVTLTVDRVENYTLPAGLGVYNLTGENVTLTATSSGGSDGFSRGYMPPPHIKRVEDDDDVLLAAWFMYMTRPMGEVETWTS
jgi:hypothetical protein